ncbi:MAG: hypothetical protein EBR82_11970 [Caulobacteraceae bacterium]|nr:hypothetical protein [Caulobacteraceae bacterium]
MSKRSKGINPDLEDFINNLMSQVMVDPQATITDKMKVVDRALKLEALKQKADEDEWGSGFFESDDDDEK